MNPFYRGRTDEPFLAIADTGHHRVLLTDCSGVVLRIVGGLEPGFKDGSKYAYLLRFLGNSASFNASVMIIEIGYFGA